MTEDIVRVIRIVVYEGPRKRVEETVAESVHGTKYVGKGLKITATTVGEFAEIIDRAQAEKQRIDPDCSKCGHAKSLHGNSNWAIDELCSCCATAEHFQP